MGKSIKVGTASAKAGELATGVIHVGELKDGLLEVKLPVVILNGRQDGPTVFLQGGPHGQEGVMGVEVFRQLLRVLIKPENLRGTIIAVPIAHPIAHESGMRIDPYLAVREHGEFPADLLHQCPGNLNGGITQRIAYHIWNEAVLKCDYALDFHVTGGPGMPFVWMTRGGTKDETGSEAWKRAVAMGEAFGVTIIQWRPYPGSLAGMCLERGIPAITPEVPSARIIEKDQVKIAVRGFLNVFRHLGMIDGEIEPQTGFPVHKGLRTSHGAIRCSRGGVVGYEAEPGVPRAKGDVIARIYNGCLEEVEAVRMPFDGCILNYVPRGWFNSQSVVTGDYIAETFS